MAIVENLTYPSRSSSKRSALQALLPHEDSIKKQKQTSLASDDLKAEVIIEDYEQDENCIHQCVRPYCVSKETDFVTQKSETKNQMASDSETPLPSTIDEHVTIPIQQPAKSFKFVLDPFQAKAIQCLEKNESVLISAHTSAGKTVIAEYAVAMSFRDKQRVIYTSPIKALSNQKYRDLADEMVDVGLLTGDVTVNPNATLIVMTTEILRSMLYRGSELIRETKWVIFDEIHYMRDRDRGVVWEESIILLPDSIRLVFLSATIPNGLEFAEWICRVKHQPCHIISTDKRPTPLQHFVFPAGGEGMFMIMDEKKVLKEENFQKAIASLSNQEDTQNVKKSRFKARHRTRSDIEKLIQMCQLRNYVPIIVFAFSKRDCESNAVAMNRIDLTDDREKKLIEQIYQNAVLTLSEEDAELPQIKFMLPLLKRGIGIHHGGLLPILREIIEMLFQESLLRVLFSTETFSMGINMPAKTVVFTNLRKWDGQVYRLINSGEYIQMAGRAGRRGLDDRGLVILMLNEQVEPEEAKKIFLGTALRLDSQFHLGYNMILNLIRLEGANPEYIMKRSFYQFQKDRSMITIEEQKIELEKSLNELKEIDKVVELPVGSAPPNFNVTTEISKYHFMYQNFQKQKKKLREVMLKNLNIIRFLTPGRLIELQDSNDDYWGWGVCCGAYNVSVREQDKSANTIIIDCLIACAPDSLKNIEVSKKPKPASKGEPEQWVVVPFNMNCLVNISKARMNIPKSEIILRSKDTLYVMQYQFEKIIEKLGGINNIPIMDPVKDMKLDSSELIQIQKNVDSLNQDLKTNSFYQHPLCKYYYDSYDSYVQVKEKLRSVITQLNDAKFSIMKDDLRVMQRLLKKLEFLDASGIVTLKGRVACEISTGDELVLSQLFFFNSFETLQPDQLVAILSCFVFDEKSDASEPKAAELIPIFNKVKEIAANVADSMIDCEIPVVKDEYVAKFKPALVDIVLNWAQGQPFINILTDTTIFEGSIIRAIRRLDELVQQLISACQIIGNEVLKAKLVESSARIRRGIIFTASLYI